MKSNKEIEKEIEIVSNFAYKTLVWVWKHEDEAYRAGTFESICFAISDFIEEISHGIPHKFVSYTDVFQGLEMGIATDCPTPNKIKELIETKSEVFET